VISALLYLQFHSVRNRLMARLRRLKRPKYLVGALIGGVYFAFYFSWLITMPGPNRGGSFSSLDASGDLTAWENLGAAILFFVMLLGWVLPNERNALAFTEAEVAFLFPAPISRRGLIQYKILRSQTGILFSTIFLALIWGRWRTGGHFWISLLGWWVIFSTLNLNRLAVSFARSLLFERGLTNWRWRALILFATAALVAGAVGLSWQSWPAMPDDMAKGGDFWQWIGTILSTGVLPYLLYPFRLVVLPYFSADALTFFIALGPALVIMALHYYLIIHADVAFEEASLEYSQKIAAKVTAFREQRSGRVVPKKARRAPFRLAPTGLPSMAFLWKNLILAGNIFTLRTFFWLVWIVVVLVTALRPGHDHSDAAGFAAVLCLALFGVSLFAGQALLRVDFRADLNQVDLLKLYPLPGWQVVLGELLAPVAILAAAQWLLVLGAAMLAPSGGSVPLGLRVSLALTAAILAPAIDLIMLLIPNGVALLMPSWVRFDKNAPRGFENFGQNIILILGQLFVLFVAMLPTGLVFWLAFFVVSLVSSAMVAAPLAALAGAAVLIVEAGCAIYFLGAAFESFDLTAESIN